MKSFLDILTSPRKFYPSVALVIFAAIAWIAVSATPSTATSGGLIPSPRQGFLAPDFTLTSLDGDDFTLSALRGRPVVINLWATWCPPCRAEMPHLERVYLANQARGVEILAVNTTYQDTERAASEFVRAFNLTFPVLLDRDGIVSKQYLLRALPTTFFIDVDGIIQQVIVGGPMNAATLESTIKALLRGSS